MKNPRLASRYAKSLVDIAVEQNSLEETLKDMQLLDAICSQSRDFVTMMRSPVIKGDKKISVVNAVLAGRVSILTSTFLKLLINKGRESFLDEIAEAFIIQYRVYKGIRMAKLTTATPVDASVVDTLRAKIEAAYKGTTINIETAVDPSLLGGFVLDMGDKQLDTSIVRDLNEIKKQFSKNLYVPQLR
jgi:F-type H+-transporting ATPase subunit delta